MLNGLRSAMGKLKSVEELFKGRHFDREIVILCVRWYLRFKLSLRDLVEMMAERGLSMAHTTIMRWVQRYAPEFEKRWRRFARTLVAGAANETASGTKAGCACARLMMTVGSPAPRWLGLLCSSCSPTSRRGGSIPWSSIRSTG